MNAAQGPLSPLDQQRLHEALALAATAIGRSDPNPRVGCVIGRQDGTVLGRGATQQVGSAHAEVMALRDAAAAGHDLAGATAWVTLEPCAHHGRTPPCCDALIAAGIGRVVVALGDPYPAVAGRGIARLRAAGLQVDLADEDIAAAARDLNIGFLSRVQRGRPWVRLKAATSLDGKTALLNGESQWLTGPAARTDGHAWRRRAGAVLSGIGTVLADDPRLDVRLVRSDLQPLRVVLDSQLRTPLKAKILAPPGRVRVYTTSPDPERESALRALGAEVRAVEVHGSTAPARGIALLPLLNDLGADGVNELHVEAGARLNTSFLAQGLVDELLLYVAPTLIGPGQGMVDWPAFTHLSQRVDFRLVEATPLGNDLRIRLQQPAATQAASWPKGVDTTYTNPHPGFGGASLDA